MPRVFSFRLDDDDAELLDEEAAAVGGLRQWVERKLGTEGLDLLEGEEILSLTVPIGTAERLDDAREQLEGELLRRSGGKRRLADRGAVLTLLLDRMEAVLSQVDTLREARRELDARREEMQRELDARRAKLDQDEAEVLAADRVVREKVSLGAWGLQLLRDVASAGVTEGAVLEVLDVIRQARMEPRLLAKTLAELGGAAEYLARLQAAVQEREEAAARLGEQIAAAKEALRKLDEEIRAARKAADEAQAEAASVAKATDALRAVARDLGIYLPAIRNAGVERIEDAPAMTARMLAGIIILAAVGAYGDAALELGPAPGRRLMGGPVLLSEIPYLLAPPEAYREMQEAQAKRRAMAEIMAEEARA